MIRVTVRCYAELNDFLAPERRHASIAVTLREHDSVKDVVESLGVPHTEVDLLLVNGEPAEYAYRVQDGDRIAVYPPFRRLDVGAVTRVRPAPLPAPRFVLDTHLGRLASHLRLLGFDAVYWNFADDPQLAHVSSTEGRILLTRDRGLLKRAEVAHGYHVWATNPEEQVAEVLARFDLVRHVAAFTRCPRCNCPLESVPKEAVLDRLEPKTRLYYDEFKRCTGCGQVYWRGSHVQRLEQLIARLTRPASVPDLPEP